MELRCLQGVSKEIKIDFLMVGNSWRFLAILGTWTLWTARGHFAPRTFYPTDILPQGYFAPGHFALTFVKIVDILP